ncbi:PREDICTED: olfactory receptor 51L1-like [Thamnophis sirtalis]|uniref:Olfactory receptor 51L1-like n=1 Tax=Thamnophis sirtalis TaxID=35019 RepID=A0A6I9Z2D7_9SAUR|nr:PREDICTED: olfactory receptor 51L1-like [Thamnophis sirtalis]
MLDLGPDNPSKQVGVVGLEVKTTWRQHSIFRREGNNPEVREISPRNHSDFSPPVFLLTGFLGLEKHHFWISLPICCMYFVALAGNSLILSVIRTDQALHSPMYYFLSMLALSDLGLSLATLPTMLSVLWFNHREIPFEACLAQMTFIYACSIMESGLLLAMAFDRLVAIRNPLRYTSVLTNGTVIKIGVGAAIRSICLVLPGPILMSLQEFGRINVLSYATCLHPDLLKLVHSDRRHSSLYGLVVMLSSTGVDSVLLVLSYVLILRTVLGVASKAEAFRALSTCVSHLCAVCSFYVPMLGLSVIHRFGRKASPVAYILIANAFLLVPPVTNPIVYSVKTKQIRIRILKRFRREREG